MRRLFAALLFFSACYIPQNDGDAPAEEDTPEEEPTDGMESSPGPTGPTGDGEIVPEYPFGCGESCPFEPVTAADPIPARAKALGAVATCSGADAARTLVDEAFATVAGEAVTVIGWESDGLTLRPVAPSVYPGHEVGLAFWADVCPSTTAVINVDVRVLGGDLRDASSKVELLVYAFDDTLAPIGLVKSHPLSGGNRRPVVISEAAIPIGTRRVAIAVLATFGAQESGTVVLDHLRASTLPAKPPATTIYSESFASQSLLGWTQLDGVWVVPSEQFMVLYNDPAKRPIESMASRTVALTAPPGTQLRASLFAATTFTDKTSLFFYRLRFDTGELVQGPRLDRGFDVLRVAPIAIPTGASSVAIELIGYLGPAETTSFSVDDILIETLP